MSHAVEAETSLRRSKTNERGPRFCNAERLGVGLTPTQRGTMLRAFGQGRFINDTALLL